MRRAAVAEIQRRRVAALSKPEPGILSHVCLFRCQSNRS
jgi:hypothetical protein